MQRFEYRELDKRDGLSLEDARGEMERLAAYLRNEHKKGKIPLIVAGAGLSTTNLLRDGRTAYSKGLPCLGEMVQKLRELAEEAGQGSEDLKKLNELFHDAASCSRSGRLMEQVDREWIGKLFGALADSRSNDVNRVWDGFCRWFFFECCEKGQSDEAGGALNIQTSEAAVEIARLYERLDAICLSANFDDFLEYALAGAGGSGRGISLFSKKRVDQYFRRNRRGMIEFSEPPHNRCVLHANGDVLWLHCSGDMDEGYCPQRGKYFPAFYDRQFIKKDDDLHCRVCGSRLRPTMTMPGTYQKDHNTRQIISSIWEHLAAKISCVITVGLSCNWDDVLLKFILGLLLEREIPHLDINSFSDPTYTGDTAVVRQIVRERRFQSIGVNADAKEGITLLAELVEKSSAVSAAYDPAEGMEEGMPPCFEELVALLEGYEEIQRLPHVSQLGLKALFVPKAPENNRWLHSKEVARIAYRLYHQLCVNSKKQESRFEQVLLCAAGLLHDCGHLPFSHLLEDVFEELSWGISEKGSFKHNQYGRIVIGRLCAQEGSKLKAFLNQNGVTPDEVIQLIEGNCGISYLDTLINSAVDADKIAYLFTDAEQMQRALMLKKDKFIEKLAENAYITQEGFVALDSTSAWYALRLLDERRRMYDELYLNPHIRCMEAAAKHIITTYFVQKHNPVVFEGENGQNAGEDQTGLGGYRIMLAIQDMDQMRDDAYQPADLSAAVGSRTKQSLKKCMEIVQTASHDHNNAQSVEEWDLLKKMYLQLTGQEWTDTDRHDVDMLSPYQDDQIQQMANGIPYQRLADVRKKIVLNYPGLVLVDLHRLSRYYATPRARLHTNRLDGTCCAQDTILLPDCDRSKWQDAGSVASIPLSVYAEKYEDRPNQRAVFQVFKIGDNPVDCEHAINMLKKELQKQLSESGGTV